MLCTDIPVKEVHSTFGISLIPSGIIGKLLLNYRVSIFFLKKELVFIAVSDY